MQKLISIGRMGGWYVNSPNWVICHIHHTIVLDTSIILLQTHFLPLYQCICTFCWSSWFSCQLIVSTGLGGTTLMDHYDHNTGAQFEYTISALGTHKEQTIWRHKFQVIVHSWTTMTTIQVASLNTPFNDVFKLVTSSGILRCPVAAKINMMSCEMKICFHFSLGKQFAIWNLHERHMKDRWKTYEINMLSTCLVK